MTRGTGWRPLTTDEIRAAITEKAREKVAAGMDPGKAIEEAGSEFRAEREHQTELAIAEVQRWLAGGKSH